MAFDYQILKNITASTAINANQVTGSDIASGAVTNSTMSSGAVTASQFNTGSIGLSSSAITGTLPVSSGGTGLSSYPNDYNLLLRTNSSSSAMEYGSHGLQSMQVFTSSGTWNVPSNVRYIRVQVIGGGGGGSGHGESGGAGGYAERILYVPSISSSVSVTTGGDAGSSFYSGAGSGGSSSSFGPYCSVGGAWGANQNNQHSGGVASVGSGGDVNLYGGGGGSHHHSFGPGGRTYFGGSVAGGHPQGGNFSHNHQSHSTPGSGGRGAYFHGHYGSQGKGGMVVITHYY
jgi:hypothetical protein